MLYIKEKLDKRTSPKLKLLLINRLHKENWKANQTGGKYSQCMYLMKNYTALIKQQINQLKTEQRTWKDTAQKIYQWPRGTQKGTPHHQSPEKCNLKT